VTWVRFPATGNIFDVDRDSSVCLDIMCGVAWVHLSSSGDTHASIFRIGMAVWTFPAVVRLVGWPAKHFGESWSGCNGIWCSASNMLPPPEKCQPTNTLMKRGFVSFPDTLKLYCTLQNTRIQDTHSARNTLYIEYLGPPQTIHMRPFYE